MLRGLLIALMLLVPSRICRAESATLPKWEEHQDRACYDLEGAKKLKIFEALCIGYEKKYHLLLQSSEYEQRRANDLMAAIDIINAQIWVMKDRINKDSNLIDDLNSELKEERRWSLRDGAKWPVILGAATVVAAAFVAGLIL